MKIRWLSVLALGVLLFAPVFADASFTDVREWTNYTLQLDDVDGVIAATSFTYPSSPHGFTVVSRTTSIFWSTEVTSQAATVGQTDVYTVALTIKSGSTTFITCDFMFARDNGVNSRLTNAENDFCSGTALVPGSTYTYQFDVTMTTGTNHITQTTYGLRFFQTDSITDTTLDSVCKTGASATDCQGIKASISNQLINTNSYVNTTCKTGASATDCMGIKASVANQHINTNSYVNLTCKISTFTTNDCSGLRATLTSIQSELDSRVGTPCQVGTTTGDCQGIKNALVYRSTQTNTYINSTAMGGTANVGEILAAISYTNGLVNLTCKRGNGVGFDCEGIKNMLLYRSNQTNGYVNMTFGGVQTESTGAQAIADNMTPFLFFIMVVALIIWAEWSKNPIMYVFAAVGCSIAVLALPSGLVWARLLFVAAAVLLSYRAFQAYRATDGE